MFINISGKKLEQTLKSSKNYQSSHENEIQHQLVSISTRAAVTWLVTWLDGGIYKRTVDNIRSCAAVQVGFSNESPLGKFPEIKVDISPGVDGKL